MHGLPPSALKTKHGNSLTNTCILDIFRSVTSSWLGSQGPFSVETTTSKDWEAARRCLTWKRGAVKQSPRLSRPFF